jgi:hypothetical protein
VRRGTLIAVIALFLLLIGAAIYQFSLGNKSTPRFCGPASPGAKPARGSCVTASVTPTTP